MRTSTCIGPFFSNQNNVFVQRLNVLLVCLGQFNLMSFRHLRNWINLISDTIVNLYVRIRKSEFLYCKITEYIRESFNLAYFNL